MPDVRTIEEGGIRIKGLTPAMKERISDALTIPNPMYPKLVRMNKSTYVTPKEFVYCRSDGDDLIVPRGVKSRLQAFFSKCGISATETRKLIVRPRTASLKPCPRLYEYQRLAVDAAMKENVGIIKLGTGVGKTLVACEIVARLPYTALILVVNTAILKQFVEEFRMFYSATVGVVGDGKKDIDNDIIVATWASLLADPRLASALIERTSVLIADECQAGISLERVRVLWKFKADRIYGLSATPARSTDDGRTAAVGFFFGPVIFSYESIAIAPRVEVIRTGVKIPMGDYHKMADALAKHANRNTLIAGIAGGEALSGRKVLILVKRVEHAAMLYNLLADLTGVYRVDADDPDKNAKLHAWRTGLEEFSILIGTTSLLAVGVDVPCLDVLIIACDLKSDVLTAQSAGRILRMFKGKETPVIYDLWDDQSPILTRQFNARREVYNSKGWEIRY